MGLAQTTKSTEEMMGDANHERAGIELVLLGYPEFVMEIMFDGYAQCAYFKSVDLPRAEFRADRGMEKCMLNGTVKAISILDKGGILKGEEFNYVHAAVREMMGIDNSRMARPMFTFEQHNFYLLSDGRIVDLDYNSQSACVTTTQYVENVRAKRSQRIKAEVSELLKKSYLDITHAAADYGELVSELGANPNPIHVEGGEGSDSHCPWRKSHFALRDGRTLIIGNGPDEGWTTAIIR